MPTIRTDASGLEPEQYQALAQAVIDLYVSVEHMRAYAEQCLSVVTKYLHEAGIDTAVLWETSGLDDN